MRSDRGREERTRGNRLLSPCRIERIEVAGQEPSPPGRHLSPCRIENRASGAGAIPARQASLTLPD